MYRETDKFFLWNWVFTLKSKMYWVYRSAVLNWVFVKVILGNTTFPLYFLYKTNYFNWCPLFVLHFFTPCLKTIGYSRKNNWVNIPKSSLSVSPDRTLRKQTCIMD